MTDKITLINPDEAVLEQKRGSKHTYSRVRLVRQHELTEAEADMLANKGKPTPKKVKGK